MDTLEHFDARTPRSDALQGEKFIALQGFDNRLKARSSFRVARRSFVRQASGMRKNRRRYK